MSKHDLLSDCNVWLETIVRWGDMDAYGHLNNTAYFRLFEDVRLRYLEQMKLRSEQKLEHLGIVVAATSAKFKTPLVYPDPIQVGCKITVLDDNRFTMLYKIVALEKNRIACTGDALLVAVDLRSMDKLDIDPKVMEIVREIEGNPEL